MDLEQIKRIKETGELPRDLILKMNHFDRTIIEGGHNFEFFPRTYATIAEHIMEHGIPMDVLDIGCDDGYQSEFFLDGTYWGVEAEPKGERFFNDQNMNVRYTVAKFPNKGLEPIVEKRTVISSMSLGWYNYTKMGRTKFRNPNDGYKRDFEIFAEGLSHAENIYIRTTKKFAEYLKLSFSNRHFHIFDDSKLDGHFLPKHCEMMYISR